MDDAISRRNFLVSSGLAVTAAGLAPLARAAQGQLYAYVARGTEGFTGGAHGGGIDVFRVNLSDGSLQHVSSTGDEAANLNGDGMCVSQDGRFLYCLNTTTALGGIPGTGGGVAAFAINREDASLRYLNSEPSMGAMPTSVRIDKTNRRVIVSNHGAVSRVVLVEKRDGVPVIVRPTDSATVSLYSVASNGGFEKVLDVAVMPETPAPGTKGIRPEAIGPTGFVQIGPACHGVSFDNTQRWIIATDNGYDHIYTYAFSPDSRELKGKGFPVAPGSAPRHIAPHPTAPYFFITNEREPSVSAFHLDTHTGEVRFIQTIATIPDGYSPPPLPPGTPTLPGAPRVSPSDIRMHPNAKFLYASNRIGAGHDSIAVFSVDADSGRLNRVDVTETGGSGQREINIEPSGKFLFAANTGSADVTAFAIDPQTGKLTRAASTSVPRAHVIDFVVL